MQPVFDFVNKKCSQLPLSKWNNNKLEKWRIIIMWGVRFFNLGAVLKGAFTKLMMY